MKHKYIINAVKIQNCIALLEKTFSNIIFYFKYNVLTIPHRQKIYTRFLNIREFIFNWNIRNFMYKEINLIELVQTLSHL